jgi:hypothetical protein
VMKKKKKKKKRFPKTLALLCFANSNQNWQARQPGHLETHPADSETPKFPAMDDDTNRGPQTQYYLGPDLPSGQNKQHADTQRRTICGLLPSTIWLLIALVVVIIAAAVGGGVGGSLSVQHCNNRLSQCRSSLASPASTSSNTTTPTSTASACAQTTVTIPSTGCSLGNDYNPPADSPYYLTNTTNPNPRLNFTKYCNSDSAGNDVLGIVASSWDLCMEACGFFNINHVTNLTCMGVSFVPSWTVSDYATSNISAYANCFLKYSLEDTWGHPTHWETVLSVLDGA